MSELTRIRNFHKKQILVAALALFIFLFASIVVQYLQIRMVANQTTKYISRMISIGDFREIIFTLEKARLDHFVEIQYRSTKTGHSFTIPTDYRASEDKAWLEIIAYGSLSLNSFNPLESGTTDQIIFTYQRFGLMPHAFGLWLLLVLMSIPQLQIMKRRLREEYKRDLERQLDDTRSQAALESAKKISEISQQVAHDIRSPLTVLNILTSESQGLSDQNRGLLEQVISRINEVAENLLLTQKGDIQIPTTSTTEGTDLRQIAPQILEEKKIEFKDKLNIDFIFRDLSPTQPMSVAARAPDVQRILSNLINNSIEAIAQDGRILVEIFQRHRQGHIMITDFGKGIPEEIIHRLGFEKLSYGKTTDRSGFGLGLKSARDYLQSVSGDLQIHSQLGQGTQITLSIPLRD